MRRIFVTGASGCVGHYVLRQLLHQAPLSALPPAPESAPTSPPTQDPPVLSPPYHVIALVRDPARLRWTPEDETLMAAQGSRLTVLQGDLADIDAHKDILADVDGLIHPAAAWGDEAAAFEINVYQTLRLFDLLDPSRCRKIIYFSTASLLDQQHQPLAVAGRAGTAYIRSKYEMLMRRSQVKLADRMITLYPTLLFGGSPHAPYSHITGGIPDVLRWMGLARFLKLEASFHFIHAADIASIVGYLLQQPIVSGDWVLGTQPLNYVEMTDQMCQHLRKRTYFRIPVPLKLMRSLAFLWGIQLSEWDDYCIQHPHFVYDAIDPGSLGIPVRYPTLLSLLKDYA